MSERSEAKAAGKARYFTGRPCKHGHLVERYVGGACVDCHRRLGDTEGRRAYARRRWLRIKFGITPEDYEMALKEQHGRCAICGTGAPGGNSVRFHVDHDHLTKTISGAIVHSM